MQESSTEYLLKNIGVAELRGLVNLWGAGGSEEGPVKEPKKLGCSILNKRRLTPWPNARMPKTFRVKKNHSAPGLKTWVTNRLKKTFFKIAYTA